MKFTGSIYKMEYYYELIDQNHFTSQTLYIVNMVIMLSALYI